MSRKQEKGRKKKMKQQVSRKEIIIRKRPPSKHIATHVATHLLLVVTELLWRIYNSFKDGYYR